MGAENSGSLPQTSDPIGSLSSWLGLSEQLNVWPAVVQTQALGERPDWLGHISRKHWLSNWCRFQLLGGGGGVPELLN